MNATVLSDSPAPTLALGAALLGASGRAMAAVSDAEAARFLAQASMGASRAQIAQVQSLGYAGWLDAQFAMPASGWRWDWLVAKGFNAVTYKNSEAGFDPAVWRKLLVSSDTLRQRVTLALSEILVTSIGGLVGAGWRQFSAAAYMDLLEANAFGNYRTLLGQVSTSAAMGQYLTYRGSRKANPATGAHPDENYARELMQLFTIGLVQLNQDGTPQTGKVGAPLYTYTQDDISGLARIFTGWDFDLAGGDTSTPDFLRRPMQQIAARHESGASSFLGKSVPAGLGGADALNAALDIIYAHPNVGPFIGRQLIQRLVCSNPSPAYVWRVAAAFNNDGTGARGNLRAVVKAVLLDPEARRSDAAAPGQGKLREPMLRFLAWARAYEVKSASDAWAVGNTSDPASKLGQSPLRSPSVFNFFRPGYVPPNSGIASAGMVAPEFQIANETSVVGYVNFMQRAVGGRLGDLAADYASLMPLAENGNALLAEINTVLAAGQLGAESQALIVGAINAMARGTDAARLNRIRAALTLALAAPDFVVLK
ncbi:DUF1800 domain-containing protein [Pseudoduganella violacea]|uniref:Uncharacterized protein (DUF1800 family) n=1 Tax=Pseudoduganella violacea TaxID=1715466 RepID=A0A7W5BFI3_9BURK|nr:DUF1800 domain-containing protein [Pseudoduganella violacea]MBB3122221.1 uncharacterized protein (DUF1800 family) [Pseudoduganella violacea]